MSEDTKYTIPQPVIDACRRGEHIIPLRRSSTSGLPVLEKLPLRPLTLDELLRWQDKYNPSAWMVVNPTGLQHYVEDPEAWDDLCKGMGQKQGCESFRTTVAPMPGLTLPFTAVGPSGRTQADGGAGPNSAKRGQRGRAKGSDGPDRVFVACRDSASKARALIRKCGADPGSFHIVSRKDNLEFGTFDDIVAALPPGVKQVVLDDVEYLLPPEQRDRESVGAFLEGMKARHGHRGFNLYATATDPSCPMLSMSVIQSRS